MSDIAALRYPDPVNPSAPDEAPKPDTGTSSAADGDVDALRASVSRADQRLSATFDTAAVGIAHVGLDGRWLRVNDRLCEFLGYARNELQARTFADVTHPDDLAADLGRVNDLLAGAAAHFTMEKRYIRQDGAIVWANLTAALVRDANGAPDYFTSVIEDITARKILDERLADSNRQLRLALQAAKAGAWDWDVERDRLQWSEENFPLYGLAPGEDLSFADWERNVHPDDLATTGRLVAEALSGSSAEFRAEFRVLHPERGLIWLLSIGRVERDRAGKALRLAGINLDITDRKLVEQAERRGRELSDAINRINNLLYSSHDFAQIAQRVITQGCAALGCESGGISLRDAHGWQITHVHNMGREYVGMRMSDAQERHGVLALESRDVVAISDTLKDARVDRSHLSAHAIRSVLVAPLLIRDEGLGAIFFNYHSAVHAFSDGEIAFARQMAVTAATAMENARLFTDLTRTTAALRESEQIHRISFDHSPIPKICVALDGRFMKVNERFSALVSYTPEELLRMNVTDLLPAEERAAQTERLAAFLSGGALTFESEMRYIRKDGGLLWAAVSVRMVTDANGRLNYGVGVVEDITARRQYEDALREADRRKDLFLATLSHELRNPLAPIRTAAQILGSSVVSAEQTQWARAVIQRQVKHMAWLLDDLLDLTRITQGKLSLNREVVTLSSIVDSAVEAAHPLLEAKRHHLSVKLPASVVLLDVDPLRLSQVLSNLLTNAAKYTDAGGQVELTGAVHEGSLNLRVRDNGIGISAPSLERVFQMFSQVDGAESRSEGGLGIGLALVKGLVELHGGTISAFSAGIGRGSEFSVNLPVVVADRHAPLESAPDSLNAAEVARKILVADDNQDAAESLAMMLGMAGHEVRVAHDGRAAVSLAFVFRPDVAIIDIGMPKMNGYDVARSIRRESWGRSIYLVALTGWGQDADRQRATEAGFDQHLTKPVDPNLIDELLAARPLRGRQGRDRG